MTRNLLVLGILLLVQQAQASTNQLTTELQRPKRYTITALAQSEANVYSAGPEGRSSVGKFNLSGSYKFTPEWRTTLTAGLVQGYEGGREGNVTNAKWTVTHAPIALTQDTSIIPVAGVRLPTNVFDRKDNSYNGSAVSETTVLTNWTIKGVPFSTVYALYLTKNFHTYERGRTNKPNLDYTVINYVGVEKYILPKLSFLIDGDYTYASTYQNSMRTQFSIGQSLTYEFSRELNVTVGHSNGGDALMANGRDHDISVYDENKSIIYANVRAVF